MAVFATSCAQAEATTQIEGEWRTFEIDRNNPTLIEIGYFEGESLHGEPYVKCDAGSGWISISHEITDDFDGTMHLRAGEIGIDLPTVTQEGLGTTMNAMLPADHPLMREVALGRALLIGSLGYAAQTGGERSSIREFIKRCRID